MCVVSTDEASNLFRACVCHGDASLCHGNTPFKMRKKCRKPSAHVPKIESGTFALREMDSAQRPSQIA